MVRAILIAMILSPGVGLLSARDYHDFPFEDEIYVLTDKFGNIIDIARKTANSGDYKLKKDKSGNLFAIPSKKKQESLFDNWFFKEYSASVPGNSSRKSNLRDELLGGVSKEITFGNILGSIVVLSGFMFSLYKLVKP
ncbi:MAG: hypothetical protein K8R21_12135 [Leptospira sp.]|nr:hypothetical protein [Leptospira sp.]